MGWLEDAAAAEANRQYQSSYTQPSYAARQRDAENQLVEQRRQADQKYKLDKKKLDDDYKIAKKNAKTAKEKNDIDKWYNEQSIRVAGERLAMEDKHFNLDLEFQKQVQSENLGLNRAKLGYDVLNMASNLRGPENYYQASNFARGVANDPNSSVMLNALRDNSQMPNFGAQYGVPDPETLSTLSSKLGTTLGQGAPSSLIPGTAATGAPANSDNSLNQIRGLYAAGAHKLGAGALEQLTDTELKLLQSGIGAVGGDVATFMDQYKRSRIGQGGGKGYVAA